MTCRMSIRGRCGIGVRRLVRIADPAPSAPPSPPRRLDRSRRRLRAGLLGVVAGLLIGTLGGGAARAADDADAARSLVDAAIRDTLAAVGAPQTAHGEMAQRLRALLDRYVDLPRVGRDSLGAYWRRASADQQSGFLALLASFLASGYSDSVSKMGALAFGPTAVVERGSDVTVVRTDVQVAGGSRHAVLFMVGRASDGSYRVVDVVAAAISLSKLLNADFGAVLGSNGGRLDALNDALERKLATTQAVGSP